MKLKELRIKAGMTQLAMSEFFGIPKRTIENWESGTRTCPAYVEKLIAEKLEEIIMNNSKEVLKKANAMQKEMGWNTYLPELEIGEICEINDVWDGNGECPEESQSYQVGETDWINYEFEILERKENELNTIIKITDICMI